MTAYADVGGGAGAPLDPGLYDYYYNFGNPTAGFFRFLGEQGMGGTDARSRWGQRQQDRYKGLYESQVGNEPGLGFYDFLRRQDPNGEFSGQTANERGYNSAASNPRGRWVLG